MRTVAAALCFLLFWLPSASATVIFEGNMADDPGLGTLRIEPIALNENLVIPRVGSELNRIGPFAPSRRLWAVQF
jgi:hypothetical protein